MNRSRFVRSGRCALVALALSLPGPLFAQDTGTITGRIVDEAGQPLSDVQVSLEGTTRGGLSNAQGRFLLLEVPSGIYTLKAQRIGYAVRTRDNVVVRGGEQAVIDLEMRITALSLEGVVVTGVVDPVEGIKLPFTVGKVTAENLQIPQTNSAIAALQGKVAGVQIIRGSGQPGDGVDVLLRTPTAIQTTNVDGRSNGPMYVVDGVILGSQFGGTTVDLNSLDIESIEVVKGAAAASLYGSRAANGVVQIRTKRGSQLGLDQTRINYRTEFGVNDLPSTVAQSRSHHYLQADNGDWLNAAGQVVPREERAIDPTNIQDNPYTSPTYDNLALAYNPGGFYLNTLSISQNTASTNFFSSVSRRDEEGALRNNEGFEQTSFRVNLDHRFNDDVQIGVSAFHSRGVQDELSGSPFRPILNFEPDVNLGLTGPDGKLVQQPDPNLNVENPLWRQASRDNENRRTRTLGSADLKYTPLSWLRVAGNFSYDRSDINEQVLVPKGVIIDLVNDNTSGGQLELVNINTLTLNGSLDATLLYNFGSLTSRATLRGLFERERFDRAEADSRDFAVVDVPDLDVGRDQRTSGELREIRANGWLADLAVDYADRYIGSFLIRRDGSSLFGPEERWNTYYRASGSWLLGRESWWPFESLNEFKVRYSFGTAGNRPGFFQQYETWTVNGSTGAVAKGTLGNRFLKPEQTTEQEVGLDMIVANRFQVRLGYVWQETEDQIIQLPLPAVTGFGSQWTNVGLQSGNTFEAEVEAFLVNTPRTSWSATFVADRSRSKIEEWNRTCFFSGLANICGGAGLGEMWGERFLTAQSQLPEEFAEHASQFQVNDDGYLVWVGEGNRYTDGLAKSLWGTSGQVGGRTFRWGIPILELEENGTVKLQRIGRSEPDLNLGLLNNIRWRGLSLHTHFHAQVGGDVYNNTRQRLYQDNRHGDVDQAGKADALKKTIDYYQALYNANNVVTHFVEDGTFLKLRTVSLTYSLNQSQISSLGLGGFGARDVTFGLIGRNLFTITDYTGFDPEAGNVLQRLDSFAFPNLRTITGTVSVTF